MYKGLKTVLLITGLCTSANALAIPFFAFEPRSLAMGGTGVASGPTSTAVLFNPALLSAAGENKSFSLDLPILGGRLADPNDLISAVDDFNSANYVGNLNNALAQLNAGTGSVAAVQTAIGQLNDGLASLSDKAAIFDGGATTVLGVPGKSVGVGMYANAYVIGGAVGDYSDSDKAQLDAIAADPTACVPSCSVTLTSSVDGRALLLSEVGVSVAHQFTIASHDVAFGVTPKFTSATTYDYHFTGDDLDNADINLSDGKRTDSTFNIDFGAATGFGPNWSAGFAIRNLISRDFTTSQGNKIKVGPQARAGVSRHTDRTTVSLDVDLTENDQATFETKTQYIALGAEFDVYKTVQLRVGYRNNLSASGGYSADTLSAGVGFSPFGAHFDLAVAGNSDEIGGALQLGFSF
jgi:hypothetical protein